MYTQSEPLHFMTADLFIALIYGTLNLCNYNNDQTLFFNALTTGLDKPKNFSIQL